MSYESEPTQRAASNGLGMAGFIVSLVGFICTGGVLCPIGLVMSLIALGKKPRGFAIAGTVIGALGSCGILLAIFVVPIVLVAVVVAGAAAVFGPEGEAQIESAVLAFNLNQYREQTGSYPDTLGEGVQAFDAESGVLKDPWDRPYIYELSPDGTTFRIYSSGPDGTPGTTDDIESEIAKGISSENPGKPKSASPATTPEDPAKPDEPAEGETPTPPAPEAPATPG